METKPYDTPTVGDTVYHIDEPESDCPGEVVFVDSSLNQFQVQWYDGDLEIYDFSDHPDILAAG